MGKDRMKERIIEQNYRDKKLRENPSGWRECRRAIVKKCVEKRKSCMSPRQKKNENKLTRDRMRRYRERKKGEKKFLLNPLFLSN
jgi:hypothetical protein